MCADTIKAINSLACRHIQQLTPYQSARRLGGAGDVWLNANEYAISPSFDLTNPSFNRYPQPQPTKVIENYARYAGVAVDNVLVSRGGDEAIELIIRAFCEQDDSVLYCPPTYGMYEVSSQTCGIATKPVPLTAEFQLDLPAIEQNLDGVKVIFICSPNNPTGTLLRRQDIIALLKMTKGRAIVVVDEAYIEFCEQASVVDLLNDYVHLAIVRTLSKAFGLAGLRCGFALANRALIEILQKLIAPYPIAVPVADIATQALSADGIAQMHAQVADVLAQKQMLKHELEKLGNVVHVFDSFANYLLVKFNDGQAVFDALWDSGIILRNQHKAVGLANCIRITIGSDKENQALLQALKAFDLARH